MKRHFIFTDMHINKNGKNRTGNLQPKKHRNIMRLDNSGVAMIVVLVIGVIVLAFCLSLLLVTYTLFSQSSRQVTRLQCKMLAQSASETLGSELEDADSALIAYLKKQIDAGYWVSEGQVNDADDETSGSDAVTELVLNLDDDNATGAYNLTATLTYTLNVTDDEGGDEGSDEDDQDDDTKGGTTGNEGNKGNANEPSDTPADIPDNTAGNGSYSIKAVIKCMRGDGTDRDVQYYVVETTYPSVSMSKSEENANE
ncbi:MAG: hypothetical protein ACI39Q_04685 [Wujia sp.]